MCTRVENPIVLLKKQEKWVYYHRLSSYKKKKMDIVIKRDGEGYIAEIKWKKSLYAYWYSEEEAVNELKNVVDMMVEYYSEEISLQKKIQKHLLNKQIKYAV